MRTLNCTRKKTKRFHDANLRQKEFQCGDKVLLFNSRLRLFAGTLKSRWTRPFIMSKVYPYGAIEVINEKQDVLNVNSQRLKKCHRGKGDELHHVAYLNDPMQ